MAAKICQFDNCGKKHDSHGFCSNHARQYRKYGHPLTEAEKHEHRLIAMNGRKPAQGKTWTIKDTSKMKGRHPKSEFKKGQKSWNKGLSNWMSEEHSSALRSANSIRAPWNKGRKGVMPTPHNKIGDGITPESKLQRKEFFKKVQPLVLARDDYTCQTCQVRGGYLQVDHIKSWAQYPDLRFDMENCRTLCMACHYFITFKRTLPEGVIWGHNLSRRITS